MSIVPLSKVTVFGLLAEKEAVLADLQRLGCLHIVPLRPRSNAPEREPRARPEEVLETLRYLEDAPTQRRHVRAPERFDLDRLVADVKQLQVRTRQATDRRDEIAEHIRHSQPWGHFELPPAGMLDGLRLWFYVVPRHKLGEVARSGLPHEVVHTDRRGAYVVVISADEPTPTAIPFERSHVGRHPLRQLEQDLDEVENELDDLMAERTSLTRWIEQIRRHLADAEDRAALRHAAAQTLDEGALEAHVDNGEIFALRAWCPGDGLEELRELSAARRLGLVVEAPRADDDPPTLLANREPLAAGEPIVSFFSQPGYRTWDPSGVIFLSFPIFFAMIVSDAGYAAVLGAFLAFFWKRMGASAAGRQVRALSTAAVAASVLYGMLAGSYFGVEPKDPGSLLAAIRLIDLSDYDAMMKLAVGIGTVHLVLANTVRAIRERGRATALAPMGWALAILGGFIGWIGSTAPNPFWTSVGGGTTVLGLVAVFLFSSARKVTRPRDVALRVVDGLLGLTGITKAFGDVLSYLRLFALGLASASLAITFNDLAGSVREGVPSIGLFLSILLLLVGHALNLVLAIVSGVVHGLRLNLIEFLGWGIADEGRPFQPFAIKEV